METQELPETEEPQNPETLDGFTALVPAAVILMLLVLVKKREGYAL